MNGDRRRTRLAPPGLLLALFVLAGWLAAGTLLPHTVLAAGDSPIADVKARFTGDLPDMRKRKRIRALVTYSRTDFFFHKGRASGLQVDFLHEYEKFLNKGVKRADKRIHITFIPVPFNDLLPALKQGRGDIAAALLTITPQREKQVAFARGTRFKVDELLVTHKSVAGLEKIDDLAGRTVDVMDGSSYLEHLEALNRRLKKKGLPAVKIERADPPLLTEDILEMVNSGAMKITVVDDYKARLWARVLPNIRVHEKLRLSAGNPVGWAIRKQNTKLQASLDAFALKVRKGSLLGNMLFKRYYNDGRWMKNPLSREELAQMKKYIGLFRKYGRKYDFDYLVLMALGFQESGLDNRKKSHRGAVGIMQMLPSTAADKHVKVGNIRNAENNIHAATKYLAFLRDRYFSDPAIDAQNRLAFTLAAYNAGPANVQKICTRAKQMGLDPNVWFANVEVAAAKYIGRETVQYVAHIYKYYVAYKHASTMEGTDRIFLSAAGRGLLAAQGYESGVEQQRLVLPAAGRRWQDDGPLTRTVALKPQTP